MSTQEQSASVSETHLLDLPDNMLMAIIKAMDFKSTVALSHLRNHHVRCVIKQWAQDRYEDDDGDTFYQVIKHNGDFIMGALLEAGADVDANGSFEEAALGPSWCRWTRHKREIVAKGITPLRAAIKANATEVVALLIRSGVKLVYQYLEEALHASPQILKLLLEYNAASANPLDVNHCQFYLCELMEYIRDYSEYRNEGQEFDEDIEFNKDAEKDMLAHTTARNLLYQLAENSIRGSDIVQKAELLLKHGAQPNMPIIEKKHSSLGQAVLQGSYDLVKFLLENGGDATQPLWHGKLKKNYSNHPNYTTLLHAVCNPDKYFPGSDIENPVYDDPAAAVEMMELLIEHGADPYSYVDVGLLLSAVETKNPQLVELLLDLGLNCNTNPFDFPLFRACEHIDLLPIAKLLISKGGADVNHVGDWKSFEERKTALHAASGCGGNIETVKLLIENGANVLATYKNCYGEVRTPLLEALTCGKEDIAELLKQHMPPEPVKAEDKGFKRELPEISESNQVFGKEIVLKRLRKITPKRIKTLSKLQEEEAKSGNNALPPPSPH